MKYFIAIIALAALAQGELFNRPCRTPEQLGVKTGFTPIPFLGRWYEIERYEQTFQVNGECVTAEYTLNADGSINVFNQAYVIANSTFIQDTGRAVISFPNEDPLRAMLNVTFFDGQPNVSNYWVLSTDYANYAFVVSCFDLPATSQSVEAFWLLSRSATMGATSRARANELIGQHLEQNRIRPTIQDPVKCRRIPGRSFH